MIKILLLCKSARLDAFVQACAASSRPAELYAMSEVDAPAVRAGVQDRLRIGETDNPSEVAAYAAEIRPHLVIIGPEEPLAAGVVDKLEAMGFPCVGPRQAAAKIEWSKAFGRELLATCKPDANPRYRVFTTLNGIEEYLHELRDYVLKPDGLTGGKGVRVRGDHFQTDAEALEYCREVLANGQSKVLVEERLDGEEFTLQSFADGKTVVHTIPVQDHKRLLNNDKGPNTGGMGSYTSEDHSLPFLTERDLRTAQKINELICAEVAAATGVPYRGIIYGGFIATADGVKVIEFNSRFGDPEAMNVLSILQSDFITLCEAITTGTLRPEHVQFARRATVCKYLVPEGYPFTKTTGVVDGKTIPASSDTLRIFQASVNAGAGGDLELTGSRALAIVGIGPTVGEAARLAENAASAVKGPLVHRTDIGSSELLQKRVSHMRNLRKRHQAA